MFEPFRMHGGFGFGGLIIGVILLVLVVMFILMIVRFASGRRGWMHGYGMHGMGMSGNDPLQIAKARYAKGEITKEELEQIKKDIA